MGIREKLVDVLQRTRDEELRFLDSLSEEERAAVGTTEAWAAKDVFAHVVAWKLRAAQSLAAARGGEPPLAFDGDIDVRNAAIFEQYRDRSWDDVLALLDQAHAELVENVQGLSDDDLLDTDRFPWQEGRPLWRTTAGTGCLHPLLHLVELALKRGDAQYAVEMFEGQMPALAALNEAPAWRGLLTYDLACFYALRLGSGQALSGDKDRAIAHLAQALELNEDVIEWSKEDPDLASLRDEPAYQALYTSLL
jgi:tetratricopeptide (TPR) repeat protein